MYTIGQVARFLGVTRDTLKYYEEKRLVNPRYEENGYRKYHPLDLHDVMTVNFYRALDIEIKKIQEIRQNNSLVDLEQILKEKEANLLEEINYKKRLLQQLQSVQGDMAKIKNHLGKFSIQTMPPLEVKGELSDYTAFDEYDMIRSHSEKKAVTLESVRRVIHFNEEGITDERFIVVHKLEEIDSISTSDVLTHQKCLYTVIENGRAVDSGENIDQEVGNMLYKIAKEKGYTLEGVAYINILLTTYNEGLERVFLEMYCPIQ